MEYQHAWPAYAAAHGKTPDEMLVHDQGRIGGFLDWLRAKWLEYGEQDYEGFLKFLGQ